MALLAGTSYDPGTAATSATTAAQAMTAIDTTNLRLNFTVPANGAVAVKMRSVLHGATSTPAILLGLLEGSTVKARYAGPTARTTSGNSGHNPVGAAFVVTGLTPSASLTWDVACGVETGVASSALKWGGPNDTTGNNARGGFAFEIWEATNLLAAVNYDPASAVTSAATTSALAMTALDTTNLRASFTTPASGPGSAFVLVRCRAINHGAGGVVSGMLGVLEGASVKARIPTAGSTQSGTQAATDFQPWDGSTLVAVSPSTSYNWDLAYAVEVTQANSALKYGGPDDTTADNAWGAAILEVWKA
jgi:hypothetical protein